MTAKERSLINQITSVRAENNLRWMGLLRLAIEHAPVEAKKILGEITENDKMVGKLSTELAGKKKEKANMRKLAFTVAFIAIIFAACCSEKHSETAPTQTQEQMKPQTSVPAQAELVPLNMYQKENERIQRFVDPQARIVCYTYETASGSSISCVPIPGLGKKTDAANPPATGATPPAMEKK